MVAGSATCIYSWRPMFQSTMFIYFVALACLLPGSSGCSYWGSRRAKAIARGNDLFDIHCSGCHGRRRLDLEKVPPDLHGVFDSRLLPSGRSATDELVRSTILTGRSGIMPAFEGSLSDEDIQDIIFYLHTLRALPKAASPHVSTTSCTSGVVGKPGCRSGRTILSASEAPA
jgi:mono/diheme cytochrome c family protein